MNMKKFTIYNPPRWLNELLEELEQRCERELTEESELYNEILEEDRELMKKYLFIAMLADTDEIKEPLSLNLEETKALSRFLFLENGKRDMEGIQMFLFGSRYTLEILQLLKMI